MSQIHVNGQQVEATPQVIVSSHEPWTEVLLQDGSVVRIKLVVTGVHRVVGQTQGPGYAATWQVVLDLVPPTEGER